MGFIYMCTCSLRLCGIFRSWCMVFCFLFLCFFFFKQKTAYEMRISDWSSDVCSSDLLFAAKGGMLLLDALRIARARRPDIQLTVVGDKRSRPFVPEDPSIRFYAHLPWRELQRLMRMSSLLVQPSSEERRVGKVGVRTVRSRG